MGGGGKGTSTSKSAPPPEIMEAYKKSIGYAGQAVSKPYEQYQGQLVAGLNPTQLQGISNVNAAQGAALPYIQQGAGYVNQASQGVTPGLINQFMSPYLSNVVNATQRNLLESNAQQQANLKGQAIQAGAFGGDRQRFAQAEMARQQGLAGGQVIGGLLNQGYGQALAGAQQNVQNMMQGGNMLGSMGQAAQQSILQGAQAQLAAGAQQQATEQAGLQAAYDQFLQRQAFPFQQAQFYANIAQGIGAGAGGTTMQTPAAPNTMSQIFGGLTALGSLGFSDERVKENIKPVGKTNDGQTIYRYNFKGSPKTEIGLIAQEVEQRHPEAVQSLGGIKMVDYDQATQEAAGRAGKAFGGSSMGGLVTPDMQRQAFAQGGFGGVPYADFFKGMSYVPAGELTYRGQSPGSTIPSGYKMEELEKMAGASDFDELNAMSKQDVENLKTGWGNIGKGLGLMPSSDGADGARAPSYSGPLSNFGPGVGSFFSSVGSALGFSEGGVVPRHGYATDGAVAEEGGFRPPTPEEVQAYIVEAAKRKKIDPEEALRVYRAEGLAGDPRENWQSKIVTDGRREESYGPFQLNMGPQGLGTAMLKETGIDPRDPANWQAGVDYGLGYAAKSGWKPWMGAAKIGLTGAATPYSGDGVAAADMPEMIPSSSGVVATPAGDTAPAPASEPDRKRSIIERILGQDMSDEARTGMLAAGLAIMGGRSPYFGVNVGKGALTGLQTYYKGLENQRELAKAKADIASTLATAGSTAATGKTTELANLATLMREYQKSVANYKNKNQPYPSWAEFLEKRGEAGKGYEVFNPAIVLEEPTAIGAPTTEAPTTEAPTTETSGTQPAAPEESSLGISLPTFADNERPSQVIQGTQTNINFSNALPDQNPFLLSMGTPEEQARGQEIFNSGRTLDARGNVITFRGGQQMAEEAKKASETSSAFAEAQTRNVQVKNVADKIAGILQEEGSDKLTTLRGEISGLLNAFRVGTPEDLKNATTSDLLSKLYAQLSLTSDMQGAPSTAGIDKIRQVERGSGSPTLVGAAAREIIGNLQGQVQWQNDMAADWADFVRKHSNTGISDPMRSEFLKKWNEKLPKYSEWGMANLPIADSTLWERTANGKIDQSNFKKGWKYLVPSALQDKFGKVVIFAGDGKFMRAE